MDKDLLDNETVLRNWESRQEKWKSIVNKQFQLSYYGKITYEVTDELSLNEFDALYGLLIKIKTDEKQSYEKSLASSKAKK